MLLASVIVVHGFRDVLAWLEWAGFAWALTVSNLGRICFQARTSDVYTGNQNAAAEEGEEERGVSSKRYIICGN